MSRFTLIVVAAAALGAGACQSDDGVQPIEPDAAAAQASEPVTSDDPEPDVGAADEDPFAVPEEIDVDYVQRVFDELFRLEGDAFRLAHDQREVSEVVPAEALDLLRTISANDDYFTRRADAVQNDLDGGFGRRRVPLQDRSFEVEELRRATGDCIVAQGEVDFRVTSEDPAREVVPHSYGLLRDEDANETGWVFVAGTAVLDDYAPLDPDEVCP